MERVDAIAKRLEQKQYRCAALASSAWIGLCVATRHWLLTCACPGPTSPRARSAPRRKVQCDGERQAIIGCYSEFGESDPLVCEPLVDAFSRCATAARNAANNP